MCPCPGVPEVPDLVRASVNTKGWRHSGQAYPQTHGNSALALLDLGRGGTVPKKEKYRFLPSSQPSTRTLLEAPGVSWLDLYPQESYHQGSPEN